MLAHLADALRSSKPDAQPLVESGGFQKSLESIAEFLRTKGAAELADTGPLAHLIVQARTFAFHLAALDVRQHSGVHERAVSTALTVADVTDAYAQLSEEEKLCVLDAELRNPRPLLGPTAELPEDVAEVFAAVQLLDDGGIPGRYVTSMTHQVSDVLEVLLLSKEKGLYRVGPGGESWAQFEIVPLFETIE